MRFLLLILIYAQLAVAAANPVDEFLNDYDKDQDLDRAAKMLDACNYLFDHWREPIYKETFLKVGSPTSIDEKNYELLTLCRSLRTARYVDPLKREQLVGKLQTISHLSAQHLLQGLYNLPAQIAIFAQTQTIRDADVPPDPFEFITQFAASDRQLAESITYETGKAIAQMTESVGTLGLAVTAIRNLLKSPATQFLERVGSTSPMIWAMLATTVAGDVAQGGLWLKRQSDLWTPVNKMTEQLQAGTYQIQVGVLLDEYYKSLERLGYFYSYNLYLNESGLGQNQVDVDERCFARLAKYFAAQGEQTSKIADEFANHTICRDAATIWVGASAFISRQLPNQPQATLVAAKLMAKAKDTFRIYAEVKAYSETLPKCTPILGVLRCFDRKTGTLLPTGHGAEPDII